jgi:hypothetical protein
MAIAGVLPGEALLCVHICLRAFVRTRPRGFSSLQLVAAEAQPVAARRASCDGTPNPLLPKKTDDSADYANLLGRTPT